MRIIFVKEHIDTGTYDTPVVIEVGTSALLLDDVNGIVEITEGIANGPIRIAGVPSSCYVDSI